MALSLFPLLLLLWIQAASAGLPPGEQESLYLVLESLNPSFPWRSLYPPAHDDLCLSPPHGVLCDSFPNDTLLHVVELNFGLVSDFTPNPSCSPHASFPLTALSSFPRLKKLFFYRCFTSNPVSLPPSFAETSPELEELVFIHNPSLSASLTATLGNLTRLRRFILTGSNVSGTIPSEISYLSSLQQLTLTANNLGGSIPSSIGNLQSLRVLDLSRNGLQGPIPHTLGQLNYLLKLDLSYNALSDRIPETLKDLQSLEFLDLSYNKLGSHGIPAFLGDMPSLKGLHLNGNRLGGKIPEMWENLHGILGIGLSGLGLTGSIPPSMGVFLRNAAYIGLDNNHLEGPVPVELGLSENLLEMHLENNRLSGKVMFSEGFIARVGEKLKLQGNSELCVDDEEEASPSPLNSKKARCLGMLKACNGTVMTSRSTSPTVNDSSLSSSSTLFDSWSTAVQVLSGFWSFCLLVA